MKLALGNGGFFHALMQGAGGKILGVQTVWGNNLSYLVTGHFFFFSSLAAPLSEGGGGFKEPPP